MHASSKWVVVIQKELEVEFFAVLALVINKSKKESIDDEIKENNTIITGNIIEDMQKMIEGYKVNNYNELAVENDHYMASASTDDTE